MLVCGAAISTHLGLAAGRVPSSFQPVRRRKPLMLLSKRVWLPRLRPQKKRVCVKKPACVRKL